MQLGTRDRQTTMVVDVDGLKDGGAVKVIISNLAAVLRELSEIWIEQGHCVAAGASLHERMQLIEALQNAVRLTKYQGYRYPCTDSRPRHTVPVVATGWRRLSRAWKRATNCMQNRVNTPTRER